MIYRPWTSRTVGFEMEFLTSDASGQRITGQQIKAAISSAVQGALGNSVNIDERVRDLNGFGHSTGRSWDVKTDSSCGWEVASPALKLDEEGDNAELKAVCAALTELRPKINHACGLHVWIDTRGMDWSEIQSILALWARYEPYFYELMPPSRHNNRYCKPMRTCSWTDPRGEQGPNHQLATKRALTANNRQSFTGENDYGQRFEKYSSLNLSRWKDIGMIEIRLHSGTVDYIKIRNWAKLLLAIVQRATNQNFPPVSKRWDRTEEMDAACANGGFTTTYFAKLVGLLPSKHEPQVPVSNRELLSWIEERRAAFNSNHRRPVRGVTAARG